jgi:hypothetical protein
MRDEGGRAFTFYFTFGEPCTRQTVRDEGKAHVALDFTFFAIVVITAIS